MQIKKEILLFYFLIAVSTALIIAAEVPTQKTTAKPAKVKCCKAPNKKPSISPIKNITEGIFLNKV